MSAGQEPMENRGRVSTTIRIFAFCIAFSLTVLWAVVWWLACVPNQFRAGPWRVVLDFGTLPVWLEAIPEGIILHVLSLAFLALAISEARALARLSRGDRR